MWAGNFGAWALAYLFYASAEPGFRPLFPSVCWRWSLLESASAASKPIWRGRGVLGRAQQDALHYLFAILTFALAYVVIDNATPLFTEVTSSQGWLLTGLRYTAMISLVGVVVTVFRPLRRFFGRVERVFLASTLIWFLVASSSFIGR